MRKRKLIIEQKLDKIKKEFQKAFKRKLQTHTLFPFSHFMDVSRHRYPFVIFIPLFFVFFFFPLDTNRLPTNPSASTSTFTMTLKQYAQIYRYNCPKMTNYSFYKVSTMCSNQNWTMERDLLPRPTYQDAAHAHKRVIVTMQTQTQFF